MKTSEDKLNEALRGVLKRKFDDYEEQPAPNALDRIRLRQASRLVDDLDRRLTADDIMTIEAADVLASRVFAKGAQPDGGGA